MGERVEEKAILEKKQTLDAAEGVVEAELSPIDISNGVYPKSYFNLNKYTTHWKLVNIKRGSNDVLGG